MMAGDMWEQIALILDVTEQDEQIELYRGALLREDWKEAHNLLWGLTQRLMKQAEEEGETYKKVVELYERRLKHSQIIIQFIKDNGLESKFDQWAKNHKGGSAYEAK